MCIGIGVNVRSGPPPHFIMLPAHGGHGEAAGPSHQRLLVCLNLVVLGQTVLLPAIRHTSTHCHKWPLSDPLPQVATFRPTVTSGHFQRS